MNKYYDDWRNSAKAQKILEERVLDPENLLSGASGTVEGVYEILFVNEGENIEISAFIGEAGTDGTASHTHKGENVQDRLIRHLKKFFGGGYLTYYTGLPSDDKNWKVKLHIICVQIDRTKRLQIESRYIALKKPFLQDSAGGKYDLYPSTYSRDDLCIHPWIRTQKGETLGQRRLAFLDRLEEIKANR